MSEIKKMIVEVEIEAHEFERFQKHLEAFRENKNKTEVSTVAKDFIKVIQYLNNKKILWIKGWNREVVVDSVVPGFEMGLAKNARFFGWRRNQYIYAPCNIIWEIWVKWSQKLNDPNHIDANHIIVHKESLQIGERTLWEELKNAGILKPQNGKTTQAWSIPAEDNKSFRVAKLQEDLLFEEQHA